MSRPICGVPLVLATLVDLGASPREPATIRQIADVTGRTIRATTIALSNAWCMKLVRRRPDPEHHGWRRRWLYWPSILMERT